MWWKFRNTALRTEDCTKKEHVLFWTAVHQVLLLLKCFSQHGWWSDRKQPVHIFHFLYNHGTIKHFSAHSFCYNMLLEIANRKRIMENIKVLRFARFRTNMLHSWSDHNLYDIIVSLLNHRSKVTLEQRLFICRTCCEDAESVRPHAKETSLRRSDRLRTAHQYSAWTDVFTRATSGHSPHMPRGSFREKKSQWMGFVHNGIICCESPLGTRLMKLKQLGDQIRICWADI